MAKKRVEAEVKALLHDELKAIWDKGERISKWEKMKVNEAVNMVEEQGSWAAGNHVSKNIGNRCPFLAGRSLDIFRNAQTR